MRAAAILSATVTVLTVGTAGAAESVAVMPFRDLSVAGGRGSVGEAIRETVTADLKQLGGVRVVERGELDRVLAEQHLQSSRADLDPATAARVGKLLGATMIVAGAYQEAPTAVRLTARFVRVETGEIVGTAKVDGPARDFLKLQDRVTAELLRSAGLGARAQKLVLRARPPLKSLKAVDLYGQAVVALDDEERRKLLVASVAEDQAFHYAATDLAALEARMKRYQASADEAKQRAGREMRAQLAAEQDPAKQNLLAIQLLNNDFASRRYRQLVVDGRALMATPPPAPPAGQMAAEEWAGFYVVMADNMLHDREAVLRDGESFLRRYPASQLFAGVKSTMEQSIRARRDEEQKRAELSVDLAKLSSRDRWDLCRVAREYQSHLAWRESRNLFRACLEVGRSQSLRKHVIEAIVRADAELADWPAARGDLELLEQEDPDEARRVRQFYDAQIPVD